MPAHPFYAALIGIGLLVFVQAHAGTGDQDMRQAAMQHRSGNTPAAMAIWKRWADKGDANAAYNLAVIHYYGDGVTHDPAEAMRWYRRSAEAGDRESQFYIGLMYQNGEGVKADASEAHRWFTAHRQHHLHHDHTPRMLAWRRQAAELLNRRDAGEAMAATLADSSRSLADLKARAGLAGDGRMRVAANTAAPAR